MTTSTISSAANTSSETTYQDIIIIGAGLSGIGAATHFSKQCPQKSLLILEGRDQIGGTWDLFRYPGIRSDSDMFTLGYKFKPWSKDEGIANGDDVRNYICEAARESGVDQKIRFGHRVESVDWSSDDALWTIQCVRTSDQQRQVFTCRFLLSCTGYYRYDQGYEPHFEGKETFKGDIIHPQKWPKDYDYSNKRVVVIGSGATAITLVPAMTDKAEHVTMLQRSPSYVVALPQDDPMLRGLRRILPERWVYRVMRMRNISFSWLMYQYCKAFPNNARSFLQKQVQKQVGDDIDMKHFTPHYNPWDERLCVVPDGDLFHALRSKKASVVTDHIECFTETGIRLKSGETLDADVIITATGLEVQALGNINVSLDGEPFHFNEKMVYRGVLIQDLPNAGMVFGYTNASWTLKADLVCEWLCRLFNTMDNNGQTVVTAKEHRGDVDLAPFVDMQSGYLQRALHQAPKQGSRFPWKMYQNYVLDWFSLKFGRIQDTTLVFSKPSKR